MDEIYIPIKSDDGVDLKIGMSLDEADRMAKWIAAAVHKARTGESCDDVGFVYWRQDTPDPMEHDLLLISVAEDDDNEGYVDTDNINEYNGPRGWFVAFENHNLSELNAWAEMPAPSILGRIPADEEKEE